MVDFYLSYDTKIILKLLLFFLLGNLKSCHKYDVLVIIIHFCLFVCLLVLISVMSGSVLS